MKVLCVGDIRGRHEIVTKAFDVFLKGDYEKIIFHGNYTNSHDKTNEDIVRCFKILFSIKNIHPDRVILLVGNDDEQYFHLDLDNVRCEGFRPDLHAQLFPLLSDNKRLFRYAYGIKNYMFTHAGINKGWFIKHYDILTKWAQRMQVDPTDIESWWQIIDGVSQTRDKPILYEVGPEKGGWKNNIGGPLWCEKEEMLTVGPIVGWHQVVGHTKQHFMRKVTSFEGRKKPLPNTSVTFIDVLSDRQQFLTLNID